MRAGSAARLPAPDGGSEVPAAGQMAGAPGHRNPA